MKKSFLAITASLCIANTSYSETLDLSFDSGIPDDFIHLEEQVFVGYMDFTINGKLIRNIKLSYNEKEIQIQDAEDFISKLESIVNLKKDFKYLIIESIKEKKSSNIDYICKQKLICNKKLVPKVIEFIYDPKNSLVSVYLNPQLTEVTQKENILRLPENKPVFHNDVRLNANNIYEKNNSSNVTNMDLNVSSLFSYGAQRINFKYGISENDPYFSLINYEKEFNGNILRLGSVTPRTNSIYSSFNDIVGFELGTFEQTRSDFRTDYLKPISVNLSSRSFVKIYHKEVLIFQETLNGGINYIKLPNLSSGVNNLRIETIDDFGVKDQYNISHVVNRRIPESNDFFWNFSAGKKVNNSNSKDSFFNPLSNVSNIFYSYFNISKKINDFNYSTFNFNIDDNKGIIGYNNLFEYNNISNQTSFYFGNNYSEFNNNFNYTETENMLSTSYSVVNRGSNSEHSFDLNYYRIINPTLSTSINFNLNKFNDSEYNTRYRLSTQKQYSLNSKSNLLIDTYIQKDDLEFSIGLRFEYSRKGKINNRHEIDFNSGRNGVRKNINLSKNYNFDKFNTNYSLNAFDTNDYTGTVFTSSFESENYGNGSFVYQLQSTDSSNNLTSSYYGKLNTSFIITPDSFVFYGRPHIKSGAIINFDKKDYGKKYSIYTGRSKKDIVAEKTVFIPLQDYSENNLRLESNENKDLFKKVNNETKNFITYTGNVANLKWNTYYYKVLYSRIIDENNEPIKFNSIISKEESTFSDEYGFFMINVVDLKEIEVMGYSCKFDDLSLEKNINNIKNIKCNKNEKDNINSVNPTN